MRTVRSKSVFVTAAAAAASLLASAGPAAAALPTVSPSVQISSLKTFGCGLSTAVGADGTGVVAYTAQPSFGATAHVYIRRLAPGASKFGPVVDLHTDRNACGLSVAVADDGTIAVGWFRMVGKTRFVEAAIAKPGKAFGKITRIQTSGFNNFPTRAKMMATPSGFVFAWRLAIGVNSPDQIRYSASDSTGAFGTWKVLSSNVGWPASALEAGNDGTVFALFGAPPSSSPVRNSLLKETHRDAGGLSFSSPAPLATDAAVSDGYAETHLQGLVRGPGGVGVTTVEQVSGGYKYYWSSLASGSAFGQLAQLPTSYPVYSGAGDGMPLTYGPVIAMPSGGKPVIGWTEGIDVVGDSDLVISSRMKVAVGQPDGSVSTPVEVAGLDSFANVPVSGSVGDTGIIAWAEASKTPMRPLLYTLVSQDGSATAKATLGSSDIRGTLTISSGQSRSIAAWVSGYRVRAAIIQ